MELLLATFKIKINGFDFNNSEDGFIDGDLYRDEEYNLWIHIKDEYNSNALHGQLNEYFTKGNWAEFGSLIHCKDSFYKASSDDNEAYVDFSKSHFVKCNYSSIKGYSFYIDKVSIAFDTTNTQPKASFFLNHAGFEVIKEYYNPSTCFGEEFKICKQRKEHCFIIKSTKFKPEFSFNSKDSIDTEEIKITKLPFINSTYFDDNEDVFLHFQGLIQLLRIYYNVPIDYIRGKIKYKNKTHIFYKTQPKTAHKINSFRPLLNDGGDIDSFISNVNMDILLEHLRPIKLIVKSRLTASLLNGVNKFLVLYGILENIIAIKHRQVKIAKSKDNFSNIKEITEKFDSLLNEILPLVKEEEKDDFKKIWAKSCPKNKPAKSVIESYLSQIWVDVSEVKRLMQQYSNNTYKELRRLRNDIAHGNRIIFDGVNLGNINQLLFLITTLSIFDIIGFTNFSLGEFQNSTIYKPNK